MNLLAGLFESHFQRQRVSWPVSWRVCLTAFFTAEGHFPPTEKAVVFDDTLFADSSLMRPLRRPPPEVSASGCLSFRYPVWLSGSMQSPLSHEENFSKVQRPREDSVAKGTSQSRDRLSIRPVLLCGETVCHGISSSKDFIVNTSPSMAGQLRRLRQTVFGSVQHNLVSGRVCWLLTVMSNKFSIVVDRR